MPVLVVATLAIGLSVHPDLARTVAAGWFACVLIAPWFCAIKMIGRGGSGIDLGHGRAWVTGLGILLLIAQGLLLLSLISVAAWNGY